MKPTFFLGEKVLALVSPTAEGIIEQLIGHEEYVVQLSDGRRVALESNRLAKVQEILSDETTKEERVARAKQALRTGQRKVRKGG